MALRDIVIHRILKRPHVLHAGFDDGRSDGAPVILFIHGLGRSSSIWVNIAAELGVGYPDASDRFARVWRFTEACLAEIRRHYAGKVTPSNGKLGVTQPIIVVGHSLGALVSVEYARRFPEHVSELILVSAPIYKSEPDVILRGPKRPLIGEAFYKSVLRNLRKRQDLIQKLNYYLRRARLFEEAFVVDERNMLGVVRSVEMAIENQSTYEHLQEIAQPVQLIYGRFDPFIIKKYYRQQVRYGTHRAITAVAAGHEISTSKRLSQATIEAVRTAIDGATL